MTRVRTRSATWLVLPAVLLTAAACTSSGGGTTSGSTPPPPPSTTAPTTTAAPTPTPTPTVSTTPTPTPTPSSTPPTPVSSTPRASESTQPAGAAFTTTCTSLSLRVFRGGAERGAEVAALQFVNTGASSCTVTGVPTATLLLNGKTIGSPSKAARTARAMPMTIEPGAYGESLLQDFSTCQAPLSDTIRVTMPVRAGAAATTATGPVKLRACTMSVAAVGPPS